MKLKHPPMPRFYTLSYQSTEYLAKVKDSRFYCKKANDTECFIIRLSINNPCGTCESLLNDHSALYQVSFYFISIHFPWIKWISYKDTSVIYHEIQPIALSNFHFLIHGKTWFETWFHATPYAYRDYKTCQTYHITEKTQPFFNLWNGGLMDIGLNKTDVKTLYDACATQQAFFKRLYEVYGKAPFVELSRSDYLVSTKSLYKTDWYIDLHKLAFVPGISIQTTKGVNANESWEPYREPSMVWAGEERFVKDLGSMDDLLDDDLDAKNNS